MAAKTSESAKTTVRKKKQPAPTPFISATIPTDIKPMLATLVDKPFEEGGWIYEIKWDGFRALSYLDDDQVVIKSRNNKDFNEKFYPLVEKLRSLKLRAILDGEIIVIDENGLPDFSRLQTWRSEADGILIYYVFDILWHDGTDLMDQPLSYRRSLLHTVLKENDQIRFSKEFEAKGEHLFKLVNEMGLEGIIAKKSTSKYLPDVRSKEWLKIKTKKFQEAIIGGYTINENTSKKFSALLLGKLINGDLVYTGSVGTGFATKVQEELLTKMNKLQTKVCPFITAPEYNKPSRFRPNPPKATVIWVKPELVAEVSYQTVSPDGTFRHPSFKGLREDKSPVEVKDEKPTSIKKILKEEKDAFTDRVVGNKIKKERNSLLNPTEESQVRNIEGHDLKFTNLSKIFWPETGYSKRDMLNYYYQIAPFILPYIKERPQTLNRFPNGITGKSFYQKDVTGKIPDWLQTYEYYSEADQRAKHFLVCSGEASLLFIAGLGCIEINPWSSTIQQPDHPDWCILDLDPDGNPFDQVIQTAREIKKLLDDLSVPAFCKTSGSTGLHIYIPFGAKYTYEESKEFGRALVKIIHQRLPDFTSIERLTSVRKGKIYLDFLQNRPQATVAAPYSIRPKPGATVSIPLHWDEVKKGLSIQQFTIKNAVKRVLNEGDLFKGVLEKGIDLATAINTLETLK